MSREREGQQNQGSEHHGKTAEVGSEQGTERPSSLAPSGIHGRLLQRKIANRAIQRKKSGHDHDKDKHEHEHDEPTEKQIADALAWAKTADAPCTEAVRSIQENVGVKQTGAYDDATARAVFSKQKTLKLKPDGQAGEGFCKKAHIIYTKTIAAATVKDDVVKTLQSTKPNGVDVAIYTNFVIPQKEIEVTVKDKKTKKPILDDKGKPKKEKKMVDANGDREFQRKATEFAKQNHSVGLDAGKNIVLSQPTPLDDGVSQLVTIPQAIHKGLAAKAQGAHPEGAADGKTDAAPPKWTKIKNFAVFTHGMEYGIATNKNKHTFGDGLKKENVRSFVTQVSDALTPDVGVELYACSTGHDKEEVFASGKNKGKNSEGGEKPEQGETRAEDSFAAHMADELATHGHDKANVYGHTTAAHTTENYNARVFGAAAGGKGEGGLHMFDVLYTEAVIQAELVRLIPEYAKKTDKDKKAAHERLRDLMFQHYKDCTGGELERGNKHQHHRFTIDIGMEMFRDPDNARMLMLDDWRSYYAPLHLKKITGEA